ncbi:pyruvate dehydrogenase [acetyl-transferring]-phosphatase 2, mitochondrial [Tachyglossus aculeatus]|uniref:pyruvate dehydrogenase [acetyl-transferring]-phosphatase 2, mitochondrial n=1 Tax=Tachyglossus aculeatus TaxID=9261 RepID=UPI0018F78390|nr:pyruvate dehydrogenase [acetyl-transferring]-phosphatase 2, mitochondrial [Tachyglossus aculeatus]
MMSRTVSSWILNCARNGIVATLQGRGCGYPRCVQKRSKMKWTSLSRGPLASRAGAGLMLVRTQRHTSTEEEFHFQLSPAQVDDVLRAAELSHKVLECDGRNPSRAVLRFESNQLAANTPNEDRRSAATCLQTRGMMFGIFDGHAGPACAQVVSERLFYYVAVSLLPHRTLEEMEHALECMKPVLPILQWHRHAGDSVSQVVASLHSDHLRVYWQELLELHAETGLSVEEALKHSFRRLDSDISLEVQAHVEDELTRNLALQVAFSGTTACVAHVDGLHLHVANAGDCRAVLGVREEGGAWSCLPLTRDHNASNRAELSRLKEEHPASEERTVVVDGRLLGVLMPSRAFGDVRFKWSRELQRSILGRGFDVEALNIYQYDPPNLLTPPYLTAEPEVTYHRLRRQDKFLVLASDGLWDLLANEDVVKLVAGHLGGAGPPELEPPVDRTPGPLRRRKAGPLPPRDQNAATHLIRHALGSNGSGDTDRERLVAMLTLPEDLARMYRDDVTVTVVYFNSETVDLYNRGNQ